MLKECKKGYQITNIAAHHDDYYKDRSWAFQCQRSPFRSVKTKSCTWSPRMTKIHKSFKFQCSKYGGNGFIAGKVSELNKRNLIKTPFDFKALRASSTRRKPTGLGDSNVARFPRNVSPLANGQKKSTETQKTLTFRYQKESTWPDFRVGSSTENTSYGFGGKSTRTPTECGDYNYAKWKVVEHIVNKNCKEC